MDRTLLRACDPPQPIVRLGVKDRPGCKGTGTMTQIPDFDLLARSVGSRRVDIAIKEALISVWNARGRADIQMIDAALSSQLGHAPARPSIKNLEHAIATLDVSVVAD